MHLDRLERVLLHRAVAVRLDVLLAEEAERGRLGDGRLFGFLHLAIGEQKLLNRDAGRDREEVLPNPQQDEVDVARLGFGLLPGDAAEGEGVLLALIAEDDPETAIAFLECCHWEFLLATPPQRHRSPVTKMLPDLRKRHRAKRRLVDVTPCPAWSAGDRT